MDQLDRRATWDAGNLAHLPTTKAASSGGIPQIVVGADAALPPPKDAEALVRAKLMSLDNPRRRGQGAHAVAGAAALLAPACSSSIRRSHVA
jgi:hypothetical protein